MFGKIVYISDSVAHISIPEGTPVAMDLMNMHVVFEDEERKVLGEVVDVSESIIKINFLGVIDNGTFIGGVLRKPTLQANIRIVTEDELNLITGVEGEGMFKLGVSPLYNNKPIYVDINELCSNHLAIFGNSGSGKSYAVASFVQSLFYNPNFNPYRANYVIFDAYGEYHNAFSYLNETYKYAFKSYSSNVNADKQIISIPLWLLEIDDFALLLGVQKRSQIAIIEKALRNIHLFKSLDQNVIKYKNNIIANAILDILLSGRPAAQIRDQIISALSKFNTKELNLESIISQPGYNRTLRQCLLIDDNGKINAIELIAEYLQSYLTDETCSKLPDGSYEFSLQDFADGLDFALIDEGIWKSEKIFDDANILRVRLNSLLNSDNRKYFEYSSYISTSEYIKQLFTTLDGKKAQIVNISIDTLDDRFAKTIVKIYSKILFNYAKSLENRSSIPFNIFLEEAHRYVQNDSDVEILGYNIFERIAKEGRKYGVLLGLISQRPCELSETCLSQCNNFLLFKMTHPFDLEYVLKVVPNITSEIIEKIKTVKPGHCIAFGTSLSIPALIKFDLPSPIPNSDNCQIVNLWFE